MSGWRERRDPVRPLAVAGVVRGVRASLRATHAVECVLIGVAAVMLARAAMLVPGVPEVDAPGAWGVALLSGALAAAAWWLEHPVALDETARELDRRLRHHGGLVTAFEVEERARSERSPMEELVRARVLARLRLGDALRAMLPPIAVPIGAPVAAGLLLLFVGDARRPDVDPGTDLEALAAGLERALDMGALAPESTGIAGGEEGLARGEVQELRRVLAAPSTLPRDAEGRAADPAAAERVEELDRRITELAEEVAPGSELHARLAEARTWLDALRMGLAAERARGGAGERPMDADASSAGDGALTAGAPDGTMSGSPTPRETPAVPPETVPSAVTAPAIAPGLAAGSWWPAEYDEVVATWVELSRAARSDARETGAAAPR